ncbi:MULTISPECIES: ABC-F family ATP-binding cassette domain-containing protein [unclassified Sphingobacterium]|uniref:ABC-F family ATP-binding cassette domain-containing protein n=1 Tax=unclassified Sphingobacterium TaxID=2609468 RepID=UPI00265D1EE1|nr:MULTISPECIES: ABC-F family ATP-binding cassette domain-containing protein [unclassified Sphingobacterium]WKK59834.1 ABC-F family ATP-binding cassette domain-containing protein [Sphingobacterium sp. BN32]
MINVNNISVSFGGTTLFSDVSFAINENDKIALMGKNGAGKSTLLKIIAGVGKPTTGSVTGPKDAVIAYLPQHLLTKDNLTVFEETSKAFDEVYKMRDELEELNEQLNVRTDYESDDYMKLIERVSELSEKFYSIEETNYDAEVEKVLKGLGFERTDFTRQTSEFSGGWRMRIELAKILLKKPDLILLDEPTNHMDIESIQWLEDFLVTQAKAVIVISHDRAFVDNITNRTIEVTMGKIYDYKAKYSHYLELRKERRMHQQKAYEEQQRFIADNQEFIDRFKGTYSKTLQVQSRVKMLEKLEIIQIDEVDTSALRLKFPPSPRSGTYPVIVEDLCKSYGDHLVFKDANMVIERGQKVAFVGKNGEGKSTMIKAIMGEIDVEGTLKVGHNAKIGYFAQNQAALLDEELTVFETIDQIAVGDVRVKIKDLLGAFMFSGDDTTKKVKVLSGGEKTRLAMIKLLLEPVNVLILDEPTNHLDMKTKDIIKDALQDFDGTLILVSHDRDFLDGLATKVFEFGNKRVREHFEDIKGFLEYKKMASLKEIEK